MRTVIIGGPRTGKTTTALALARHRPARDDHRGVLVTAGWPNVLERALVGFAVVALVYGSLVAGVWLGMSGWAP